MLLDKKFKTYKYEKVSDGIGGYTPSESLVQTFNCFKSPLTLDKSLKEFGIVSKESYQLLTKDNINTDFDYILDVETNKKYKLIQMPKYKNKTILVIEVL